MKDKVLIFIIGLLIGAIIATTVLFFIEKGSRNQFPAREEMEMMRENGQRPEKMPDGENFKNGFSEDGQRPDFPNKENMKEKNVKEVVDNNE